MRDDKGALADEVLRLKRRMDSLYERSFPAAEPPAPEDPPATDFEPASDLWEGPTEWRAVLDLPGVRDEDLKVEVVKETLVVSGARRPGPDPEGLSLRRAGRPAGGFRMAFELPAGSDADAVSAELRRGVLTVRVPRRSA